jgi:hypothetical protein
MQPWLAIALSILLLFLTIGLQGCGSEQEAKAIAEAEVGAMEQKIAGPEVASEDEVQEGECSKKVNAELKAFGDKLRQDAAAVATGVAELVKQRMPWATQDGNDMELCKLVEHGQDGILNANPDDVKVFIERDLGPSRKHWDGKRPSDTDFEMYTDLVATVGLSKLKDLVKECFGEYQAVCHAFTQPPDDFNPQSASLLALETAYPQGFMRLNRRRKHFFGM